MNGGVSFICRVRDEQATLARSLDALTKLTIPYEAVVILDRCRDGSLQIARKCQTNHEALRIIISEIPISRAGVETLITAKDSEHSLASYYNRCFGAARYTWRFKYDADFIPSPELIKYLNSGVLFTNSQPRRIRLPCRWDAISNNEEYLYNCLERFTKHIFWEVPIFAAESTTEGLNLPIEHVSSLSDLKSYWREKPWFIDHDGAEAAELRQRYAVVIDRLGPEPIGMARASNPECDVYLRSVNELRPALETEGIHFFE